LQLGLQFTFRFRTAHRASSSLVRPTQHDRVSVTHIDPRTDRLMAIAHMNGGDGPYMAAPAIPSQEVDKAFGRRLTLNVTAALGAIMCELGFPAAGTRGLAAVSRTAGLLAHDRRTSDPIAPALMDFASRIKYLDPD
jgi:citrate synthase